MGKEIDIFVFVGWNKARKRVEIRPSSIEVTDAVYTVTWCTYGPDLNVIFEDAENLGPFADLAGRNGTIAASGNRGPRPPAGPDQYRYKVEIQSPDGPKTGSGRVINRATKPKRGNGNPTNPLPPSGPPDITLKRTGTTVTVEPELFKMPKGKPYVVWEFSDDVKPKGIKFPAAEKSFEWVGMMPFNCVGIVDSKAAHKRGSSFEYEIEVEGQAQPVKGVIRRG